MNFMCSSCKRICDWETRTQVDSDDYKTVGSRYCNAPACIEHEEIAHGLPIERIREVSLEARLVNHLALSSPSRLQPLHDQLDAICESDAAFLKVWDGLAEQGACDARGGAEQRRVKEEWYAAGKPDLEPFIRERANIGPH